GLGLGDLLFCEVAKEPAWLADLFRGDIGVIVEIAPVGLVRLIAISPRAMPPDIVLHDHRVAVDPPALVRADQLAIVVGLVRRDLSHCSPSPMALSAHGVTRPSNRGIGGIVIAVVGSKQLICYI